MLNTKVHNFEPLQGGHWSAAFAFDADGEALVLRVAHDGEGFAIDQRAYELFAPSGIPIPAVYQLGQYEDLSFAISQRRYGQILESIGGEYSDPAIQSLRVLLTVMRRCVGDLSEPVVWYNPDSRDWTKYLMDRFERRGNTQQPDVDETVRVGVDTVRALLGRCPERRDLIHGDLFHQNVLLGEDAASVTAVFSWKCSARGDFLYDVAWSAFWGQWFEGFSNPALTERLLEAPDLVAADLQDHQLRLTCYQLHIALTHIDWYLQLSEPQWLNRMVTATRSLIRKANRWT